MLVSLKPLMEDAMEKGYAVGAFNVPNLESVRAIINAAEATNMPVILNYAEGHSEFISMDEVAPIMLYYAKKATVPVCVHLDHGADIETCIKAIRLGFTSVMIDASASDYESNVATTAEVVRLAHSIGVTVEAELGHIFAFSSGETSDTFNDLNDVYTDPATAKDFVERTGVDVLAIAFGTSHGVYTQKPVLDLDRITAIKNAIDIPFVMHGGSGLSKEEFQTAVRNGVRKINYYTYMTLAGGKAVKEALDKKSADEMIFYHDIPGIAIKAMQENIEEAINVFALKK